jgi:hypothetical protein
MLHLSWIVCRLWNDRHGFVCEVDTAISQITVSSSVGSRRYIARREECFGFVIERVTARLEMHQVRAAADLDIAPQR